MVFFLEFWQFTYKQAYACLFGGVLLAVILVTRYFEVPFFHRYDIIFLSAILIQVFLVVSRLETRNEIAMVAVFHVIATGMELFKTSPGVGSWVYPEAHHAFFHVMSVPLFSGFLYSAVGSYLARVWRIFRFRFTHYPSLPVTFIFALLVYVNFFTHHFLPDFRIALFIFAGILYWKTKIFFTITAKERSMPLLFGFLLVSLFIWFAENIGTFASVWLYPFQIEGWRVVPFQKLGAWYLLMMVSFVLISLNHRKTIYYRKTV